MPPSSLRRLEPEVNDPPRDAPHSSAGAYQTQSNTDAPRDLRRQSNGQQPKSAHRPPSASLQSTKSSHLSGDVPGRQQQQQQPFVSQPFEGPRQRSTTAIELANDKSGHQAKSSSQSGPDTRSGEEGSVDSQVPADVQEIEWFEKELTGHYFRGTHAKIRSQFEDLKERPETIATLNERNKQNVIPHVIRDGEKGTHWHPRRNYVYGRDIPAVHLQDMINWATAEFTNVNIRIVGKTSAGSPAGPPANTPTGPKNTSQRKGNKRNPPQQRSPPNWWNKHWQTPFHSTRFFEIEDIEDLWPGLIVYGSDPRCDWHYMLILDIDYANGRAIVLGWYTHHGQGLKGLESALGLHAQMYDPAVYYSKSREHWKKTAPSRSSRLVPIPIIRQTRSGNQSVHNSMKRWRCRCIPRRHPICGIWLGSQQWFRGLNCLMCSI